MVILWSHFIMWSCPGYSLSLLFFSSSSAFSSPGLLHLCCQSGKHHNHCPLSVHPLISSTFSWWLEAILEHNKSLWNSWHITERPNMSDALRILHRHLNKITSHSINIILIFPSPVQAPPSPNLLSRVKSYCFSFFLTRPSAIEILFISHCGTVNDSVYYSWFFMYQFMLLGVQV